MGAAAADVVAGTRRAAIIEWSDAGILAVWPDARDQKIQPATGMFDTTAHASAALTAKSALLGAARTRCIVTVADMLFIDPAADGVPTYRIVDAAAGIDADCVAARVEIDLNAGTTTIEAIG